jgi:predicted ATPase
VPASLHASLMARLDRLGTAKGVAQIGATIGREFSHELLARVARVPAAELAAALDRLIQTGLLSRRGSPPLATYLFKHALVQDAAYGTLLREPRRALHTQIAETLESRFADIAESHPELLARHCTDAGLIEKASRFWGKAGQRSLARSALIEAETQLARALAQIATLPSSPTLRRDQITLQVALANAQMHTKGFAAPDTRASFDRVRVLIERAEALGEPAEDPLVLYSVLYGFCVANYMAFKGDVVRAAAAELLALAEKQGATVPLMVGHRFMGVCQLHLGALAEGRAHLDRAVALYDPKQHRSLATRYGQDPGTVHLYWRSVALWLLGYPDAARADADRALRDAHEFGHAATLIWALTITAMTRICCGNYAAAKMQADEAVALADEKGAVLWQAVGMRNQGCVFALTGRASDAVASIATSIAAYRSTGSTVLVPFYLSYLARAHADLGQFDDARRRLDEALAAVETSGERWCEADILRMAGEIELMAPERDARKAQYWFERSIEVARARQARSWELRAATSLARLWRDQGRSVDARDLLAPVYGWFTEGFDTLDLSEAKATLDELTV